MRYLPDDERMLIMTENTMNPNEPQKLNDDELSKVAGGYGRWDIQRENLYRMVYDQNQEWPKADFETWVTTSPRMDDDSRRCRLEWIAAGRPNNRQFIVSNEGGPVWSCSLAVSG